MSRIACYWILVMLVGCGDPEIAKLDRQLAELRARTDGKAMSLPQASFSQAVIYDQADDRSPFRPRQDRLSREHIGTRYSRIPNPDRVREPLEIYPLDSLSLIGTLRIDDQPSALLRDPTGHVHRLHTGNHIGIEHGRIVRITKASLELVEIISSATGGWKERRRIIALNDDNHDPLDARSTD